MAIANWTDEQVFNQMRAGRTSWAGATITYTFPTTTTGLNTGQGEGASGSFRAASLEQQRAFALAIMTWDELIVPSFVRGAGNSADIEFAYSTAGVSYAHAYFPPGGTVWFNASQASLLSPAIGNYGFQTLIHEIGHAIGLNHMGNYDGAGSWTPSSYQDSVVLSIMSYFGPSAPQRSPDVADADWTAADGRTYAPQTPMVNDVMVIQRVYGASTTTRLGDTVYGFGSNITGDAGAFYDFTRNPNPILTIFDSGGVDTLNLSGWSTPSQIDLGPGRYSSANAMTNNLAIAFSAIIENALGGSGNDTLTGNSAANRLEGGPGNDVISGLDGDDTLAGGPGNDTIDGGAGSDIAVMSGLYSSFTFNYSATADVYTATSAAFGTDTYRRVEFFQFTDGLRTAEQLIANDLTPPALLSTSPLDNATGVAVSTNLTLVFSEAIRAGTGAVQIFNVGGTLARSVAIGDTTQVSIGGSTLTINPASDLAADSAYYVNMAPGVITDLAGNPYAGFSSNTAFNFSTAPATTGDITPPRLASSSPSDNATGVAANANLVLTFSEPVAIGSGTISFFDDSGSLVRSIAVGDSSQVSVSGSSLTVDPSVDLPYGTSLYVNVSAGTVRDLAGNAFAGIIDRTTLNFSTAAGTTDDYPWDTGTRGIVVVDGGATPGVIEVAGDRDLFRVELVAGTAYAFELQRTTGGLDDPYLWLYDPSVTLVAYDDDSAGGFNSRITFVAAVSGTHYLGASDFAPSGFGGYTLTARSIDTTAPRLVGSSPADNASGVAPGANLVLTFSEAIVAGVGNISIFNGNGTVARSISISDASQVSVSGSTLTINPASDLAAGSDYYVQLPRGVVTDRAGNDYAGIADATSLNFTTQAAAGTDDFPLALSTTGVLVVDGAATSGVINFVDDGDLFKVVLAAGQSYVFQAVGVGLPDPYIVLYSPTGDPIAFDDDSGSGLDAQLVYTAAEPGTHYVAVFDYGAGVGGYRVSAARTADDYPWSTSTTGVVSVGGSAVRGVVNVGGDADLFRVVLVAGTSYTFDLVREAGGLTDPYLSLFDPALNEVAYDDDGGGSGNSRIVYTATVSGSFYLGAMDYDTGTGAYLLSASTSTPPAAPSYIVSGTVGRDCLVLTGGNRHQGGGGGDTYIISPATLSSAVTATITDTDGVNVIQLVDGATISASLFLANALQLTLSTGARVQVLGAAGFTYQAGANALAGDAAASLTYAEFAALLGTSVPTGTASNTGTPGFVVATGLLPAPAPVPALPGSPSTLAGTLGNDVIVPTAGNRHLGGAGNDTYVISPNVLAGSVVATISDTEGSNVIQLVDATVIRSSSFLNNAVELTLATGARVQILGASGFSFQLGANAPGGDVAPGLSYAGFAAALGASVPAAGAPAIAGTPNFTVPSGRGLLGGLVGPIAADDLGIASNEPVLLGEQPLATDGFELELGAKPVLTGISMFDLEATWVEGPLGDP